MSIIPNFLKKTVDAAKVEVANAVVRGKIKDFSRILSCPPSQVSAWIKGVDDEGNFIIELYKGEEKVKEIKIEDLMF